MYPVGVSCLLAVALTGLSSPVPHDPVQFDWMRFGEEQRRRMPAELKRATPLTHIGYLAEGTAEKLWTLGIPPNHDQGGRERAQRLFRDSSLGTCGHTAQCLRQVWLGAGVPATSIATAVVWKGKASRASELNFDHAAVVYVHPDGAIVFDLWCHGRAQHTFAFFRSSVWRGMPLGEWGRRMALEGYTIAALQEHPELGERTPYAFADLVRRLSSRRGGTP